MAKGYWIGRIEVHDPQAYAQYVAANGPVYAKFGGRFLVRGGAFECVEGNSRDRNVVLEFPSYQAALACYHSPDYASVRELRQAGAMADLIVIEGFEGAQPGE
ncbi:DUF1330 domain-containing protein [Yimella sp. cx-51]|uniref:DUF1330 domain-containing protein n=1 Tax=Yimella sp. cx-51 TaxID=2770551 RepID=UPI00165E29DA|nr:DUF1330 domain-containing protein [Yimella sp. cx-51]MBC9955748.1 DUF1330 domain-containing protein [Yimella sp. cx-51]QTH37687.1 DUF1330 domain-containing protein [Yimella sp. cx-51]